VRPLLDAGPFGELVLDATVATSTHELDRLEVPNLAAQVPASDFAARDTERPEALTPAEEQIAQGLDDSIATAREDQMRPCRICERYPEARGPLCACGGTGTVPR